MTPEMEPEREPVECECECCGLTEECTPTYAERVRERYGGRWICGLCGDDVGEELGRASPPISLEEALNRHVGLCRAHRTSALPSPMGNADHLIAAVRRLLLSRRGLLGSPPRPRTVRSTPSSPRREVGGSGVFAVAGVGAAAAAAALGRTESCFPALAG